MSQAAHSSTPQKLDNATFHLSFQLEGLPKTANGSRGHWRVHAAHQKAWKQKAFMASWHKRPAKPLELAAITFTRCSSAECDYDNLVISFKPIMDGLRQAKVIVDDKRANVGRPEYLWLKCKPKQGHVIVDVKEIKQKEQT